MNDLLLSALSLLLPGLRYNDFIEIRHELASGLSLLEIKNPGLNLGLKRSKISLKRALEQAQEIIDQCESLGAKIIYPGHSDFPKALYSLEQIPLFLSYWGEPAWLRRSVISIVGSREPSSLASRWLEVYLPRVLKVSQCVTASGGARGVDQKVHSLSLQNGLPTVAFLPSGLGRIYPADLRGWKDGITEAGGAIVSEFAPFEEMRKYHFLRRNRVIAALGCVVFIVEARRKSGSVMTARLALDADKTVCVLPASPLNWQAQGGIDLLFDGAFPIRDDQDLLMLLGVDLANQRSF
jgi:DNA processing protein